MTSWLDILARREGMPKEKYLELKRRETQGCVIRSLESATGVRATNKEWRMRFDQLDGPELRGAVDLQERMVIDFLNVRKLVDEIELSGSPMGVELARRTLEFRDDNNPEGVVSALDRRVPIIIMGIFREEDNVYAHATHLRSFEGDVFHSRSDPGQLIRFPKACGSIRTLTLERRG